jgi:hypothetical protein
MSRMPRIIGLMMMTLCAASAVGAHDLHSPHFSFNGFATLGVVHSNEEGADFASSPFNPDGAGYTHRWSFDVDSRIGGQVTASLTPQLSVTLQAIAVQRYDDTYKPTVEWANVKYAFTPDLSMRIGRIALPGLLASDYRNIGYALPWVRPPVDVYSLRPITKSDGMDVIYRFRAGELGMTLHGYYGNEEAKVPAWIGGGTARSGNGYGIVHAVEYGSLTGQIAYQRTRVTVPGFEPFFNAFRQFGPEGAAIANKYNTEDKPYRLVSLGASYDPGQWFVTGEWARTRTHSLLGDKTAWYIGGGYRFGRFTPYAIYSTVKANSSTSDPGVADAAAGGLNAALNQMLAITPVQNTIAVGGRWDVAKNAAVKLQYDHVDIRAGSLGPLVNPQPGFQPGGKVNVVSIALDFVF